MDQRGPGGWWKGSASTLKLGEKGPDSVGPTRSAVVGLHCCVDE